MIFLTISNAYGTTLSSSEYIGEFKDDDPLQCSHWRTDRFGFSAPTVTANLFFQAQVVDVTAHLEQMV